MNVCIESCCVCRFVIVLNCVLSTSCSIFVSVMHFVIETIFL